ncbi:chromosome transmission fidelity protein 8 [Russula dissimulans]|nr:chromosome transmission fidelity protein 8 [Russula dissimulans]
MILPLTLPAQPSPDAPVLPPALASLGSSELFLLELQGELEVSGDKHGQLVGRLSIAEDGKGKPTLRIGHHLLEGKVVSLAKPLAVLQRACASLQSPPPPPSPSAAAAAAADVNEGGDRDRDIDMRCNDGDSDAGNNTSTPVLTSYVIRTLIRKKIVFSKRPTPIVGLSAKTT